MPLLPRLPFRTNRVFYALALGIASSVACSSSSSGSGTNGPIEGGTPGADATSGGTPSQDGEAADAPPVPLAGPLYGTEVCTVVYASDTNQQTTTNVTVLASQVTLNGASFTATGLTVGPFAATSCANQTVNAVAQPGAAPGAMVLVPNEADGGSLSTSCANPELGPLTVAVESGYYDPGATEGQKALTLYLEIVSDADGGAWSGYEDAAVVQASCAYTLMPN